MLFKLDENLPNELAARLLAQGHDAHTCHQEGLQGAQDPSVANRAFAEQRMLVTFDLDFSDARKYPPGSHPGIIILRLRHQDIDHVIIAVEGLLDGIPLDDLIGNLVIVEDTRIRIRRS